MSTVIDLTQHRHKNPAASLAPPRSGPDRERGDVREFAAKSAASDESGSSPNSDGEAERVPAQEPACLSETADRRLRAARLWITLNRPYYSRALFGCPLIPTQQVETMAIDDRWRIYVNSAFVESRSVEQTAAVLIHELNHGLRAHSRRADTAGVGSGQKQVWNAAADCEINDDLVEDDLDLPDGLLPQRFRLEDGRTAEHYFEELLKQATVIKVELHCGSGCTGEPADYEEGPAGQSDTADGLDPVEQDMLRRVVADAVCQHARAKGIGTIPAGLRRWADQTLDPKVNWAPRAGIGCPPGCAPASRRGRLHVAASLPTRRQWRADYPTRHDPARARHRGSGRHFGFDGRARPSAGTGGDPRHPQTGRARRRPTGVLGRCRRRRRGPGVQYPPDQPRRRRRNRHESRHRSRHCGSARGDHRHHRRLHTLARDPTSRRAADHRRADR